MPKKPVSKKQARFLGFIAGGGKPKGGKGKGLTSLKAKEMMRGTRFTDLPESCSHNDPIAMERIPGGRGAAHDPSMFDQKQLMMGLHHELEHSKDIVTAMEIAMDHLAEDPEYYGKMEEHDDRHKNFSLKQLYGLCDDEPMNRTDIYHDQRDDELCNYEDEDLEEVEVNPHQAHEYEDDMPLSKKKQMTFAQNSIKVGR